MLGFLKSLAVLAGVFVFLGVTGSNVGADPNKKSAYLTKQEIDRLLAQAARDCVKPGGCDDTDPDDGDDDYMDEPHD